MAYPFGTVDERIINIIKKNTPILYSRNIYATYNFDLQKELIVFFKLLITKDQTEKQVREELKKTYEDGLKEKQGEETKN